MTHRPAGAQMGEQFLFQSTSGLDEQGALDGLV